MKRGGKRWVGSSLGRREATHPLRTRGATPRTPRRRRTRRRRRRRRGRRARSLRAPPRRKERPHPQTEPQAAPGAAPRTVKAAGRRRRCIGRRCGAETGRCRPTRASMKTTWRRHHPWTRRRCRHWTRTSRRRWNEVPRRTHVRAEEAVLRATADKKKEAGIARAWRRAGQAGASGRGACSESEETMKFRKSKSGSRRA